MGFVVTDKAEFEDREVEYRAVEPGSEAGNSLAGVVDHMDCIGCFVAALSRSSRWTTSYNALQPVMDWTNTG